LRLFFSLLDTDKTLPAAVRIYSEALKAWGVFDLQCRFRCRLVKGYVQLKDYDKAMELARIAVQRDIDDSNNVQNINEIAQQMSNSGYKEEAVKTYQAIIQKYPEHPETHEAYGGLILNLLDLGRKKQAAQRVEEYTAKYAGKPEYMSPDGEHAGFAPKAQWIIKRLQKQNQMDEALTLAEGLNDGQSGPTIESIKTLAVARIKAGQLAEAAKLTNTLIKDYPMDEAGAMAVVEVAAALRESGQMDTAMGLYEYAIGIAKGTKAGAMARAGRAQIWAKQGKDEDVKAEVDAIIADANSLPDADLAVFMIGEEYYNKAFTDDTHGRLAENSSEALNKAIEIWQKPVFSSDLRAISLMALCYQRLGQAEKATLLYNKVVAKDPALAQGNEAMQMTLAGDRYCGAYAVWHVLKYYGKTVSIDDIAIQMGIPQKGFATVQDIVKTFEAYEIPAQAVRIPTNKAAQLDTPFVQYRIPAAGSELGHFVLCIPTGNGKAIMLDGVQEPQVIDLTVYEARESFWDGTIILIQQGREEHLDAVISQQISWETAQVAGRCWLENGGDCYDRAGLYYSRLSEQKQAYLRGGCKYDCLSNGSTCYTVPACTGMDEGCSDDYVCTDTTKGKTCQKVEDWLDITCQDKGNHQCTPKKRQRGDCSGGECVVASGSYGDCDSSVPQCKW
jgi:tetratricopeptide (TPR) repeat protein